MNETSAVNKKREGSSAASSVPKPRGRPASFKPGASSSKPGAIFVASQNEEQSENLSRSCQNTTKTQKGLSPSNRPSSSSTRVPAPEEERGQPQRNYLARKQAKYARNGGTPLQTTVASREEASPLYQEETAAANAARLNNSHLVRDHGILGSSENRPSSSLSKTATTRIPISEEERGQPQSYLARKQAKYNRNGLLQEVASREQSALYQEETTTNAARPHLGVQEDQAEIIGSDHFDDDEMAAQGDLTSTSNAARPNVAHPNNSHRADQDPRAGILSADNFEDEGIASTNNSPSSESGFLVEATLVGGDDTPTEPTMTHEERTQFEQDTRDRVLEELLVDAKEAIPVDSEREEQQKRRRRIVIAGLLVLLGVVLGSVFGIRGSTPAPEIVLVTPAPSISSMPSTFPSQIPSASSSPSQRPSDNPSRLPTVAPTRGPDNSFCLEAYKVNVGDKIHLHELFGSPAVVEPNYSYTSNPATTTNIYEPSLAPSLAYTGPPSINTEPEEAKNLLVGNFYEGCSPNLALSQRSDYGNLTCQYLRESCSRADNIEILVPGRWFQLAGVDGPVTVHTCNNETNVPTLVQVYTTCPDGFGYGACASGLTYQSVDNHNDCEKVSWPSKSGVDYTILVLALDDNNGGGSVTLEILNNDNCENAIGPLSIGDTFFGIIETNGETGRATLPQCDDDHGEAWVVGTVSWWHVLGTGGRMTADTCNAGTFVDTQISVWKGSCGDLECVASNDDACGQQSLVSWESERDVTYYIGVHGKDSNTTGDFDLHIDGDESNFLLNDFCDQAQEIVVGSGEEEVNLTIPLTDAKVDLEPFNSDRYCYGTANNHDRWGVWYWIRAENGSVRVSVESPNSDPWLTAFDGEDCENLVCWLDTFDAQTKAGTIPAGQSYRVYVHYAEPQTVTSAEVVLRIRAALG